MKLPRDVGGRRLVDVLVKLHEYRVVHERGSHIVLQTEDPSRQRIVVPDHKYLRIGTLSAILRAVSNHKGVDRQSLLDEL